MGVVTAGNREQGTGNRELQLREIELSVACSDPRARLDVSLSTPVVRSQSAGGSQLAADGRRIEASGTGEGRGALCSLFPVPCSLA
jgi:hypothetical protein